MSSIATPKFAAASVHDHGYATGKPHGWIESLTAKLERIILGRSAQAWLDGDHGPLPRHGCIITLPSWRWAPSRISVGRKDLARDGGRLLMPVRLSWSMSPLMVLATGDSTDIQWRAVGMGHTGAGATTVRSTAHIDYLGDVNVVVIPDSAGMPVTITADPMPGTKMRAHLRSLVEDGKAAHWEAVGAIEPYVTKAVENASVAIAARLRVDGDFSAMLDPQDTRQVADDMLYGSPDSTRVSDVFRLINRCLEPAAFAKVEPERYIRQALRSAADSAVRRKVGDPFIGDKIRAVQQGGGYATIEDLVAAYRERYPRDRLSTDRARTALDVCTAPTVFPYEPEMDDHATALDFADALVDVIDMRRARADLARANSSAGAQMDPMGQVAV